MPPRIPPIAAPTGAGREASLTAARKHINLKRLRSRQQCRRYSSPSTSPSDGNPPSAVPIASLIKGLGFQTQPARVYRTIQSPLVNRKLSQPPVRDPPTQTTDTVDLSYRFPPVPPPPPPAPKITHFATEAPRPALPPLPTIRPVGDSRVLAPIRMEEGIVGKREEERRGESKENTDGEGFEIQSLPSGPTGRPALRRVATDPEGGVRVKAFDRMKEEAEDPFKDAVDVDTSKRRQRLKTMRERKEMVDDVFAGVVEGRRRKVKKGFEKLAGIWDNEWEDPMPDTTKETTEEREVTTIQQLEAQPEEDTPEVKSTPAPATPISKEAFIADESLTGLRLMNSDGTRSVIQFAKVVTPIGEGKANIEKRQKRQEIFEARNAPTPQELEKAAKRKAEVRPPRRIPYDRDPYNMDFRPRYVGEEGEAEGEREEERKKVAREVMTDGSRSLIGFVAPRSSWLSPMSPPQGEVDESGTKAEGGVELTNGGAGQMFDQDLYAPAVSALYVPPHQWRKEVEEAADVGSTDGGAEHSVMQLSGPDHHTPAVSALYVPPHQWRKEVEEEAERDAVAIKKEVKEKENWKKKLERKMAKKAERETKRKEKKTNKAEREAKRKEKKTKKAEESAELNWHTGPVVSFHPSVNPDWSGESKPISVRERGLTEKPRTWVSLAEYLARTQPLVDAAIAAEEAGASRTPLDTPATQLTTEARKTWSSVTEGLAHTAYDNAIRQNGEDTAATGPTINWVGVSDLARMAAAMHAPPPPPVTIRYRDFDGRTPMAYPRKAPVLGELKFGNRDFAEGEFEPTQSEPFEPPWPASDETQLKTAPQDDGGRRIGTTADDARIRETEERKAREAKELMEGFEKQLGEIVVPAGPKPNPRSRKVRELQGEQPTDHGRCEVVEHDLGEYRPVKRLGSFNREGNEFIPTAQPAAQPSRSEQPPPPPPSHPTITAMPPKAAPTPTPAPKPQSTAAPPPSKSSIRQKLLQTRSQRNLLESILDGDDSKRLVEALSPDKISAPSPTPVPRPQSTPAIPPKPQSTPTPPPSKSSTRQKLLQTYTQRNLLESILDGDDSKRLVEALSTEKASTPPSTAPERSLPPNPQSTPATPPSKSSTREKLLQTRSQRNLLESILDGNDSKRLAEVLSPSKTSAPPPPPVTATPRPSPYEQKGVSGSTPLKYLNFFSTGSGKSNTRRYSTTSISKEKRYKLVFTCPAENLSDVKQAVFKTGAGVYPGCKYERVSFDVMGRGRFTPVEDAKPAVGEVGKEEEVEEVRCEIFCGSREVAKGAVEALIKAHPYEQPAYEVVDVLVDDGSVD